MNNETTTVPMSPERRQRFEQDLDQMRVRTSSGATDAKLAIIGLGLMGLGIVIALAAYVLSGGQSVAAFLRMWLLRLIYEHQLDD